MFDPEKVDRWEAQGQHEYEGMGVESEGDYVLSEDYDELLKLYKEVKGKYNWLRDGVRNESL